MASSFTKLASSITDSTVWGAPYATRIAWIAMLAMADRHGCIHASVPGLARRAAITLDECKAALETFLSPDEYSRTPDYEGRRIEVIDGGWRLLNYFKYRDTRDEDAKREADAARQRRHRASRLVSGADSDKSQPVTTTESRHAESVTKRDSHAMSHEVAQAEAEAEADGKDTPASPVAAPPPFITLPMNTGEAWPVNPEMVAEWKQLFPAIDVEQCLRQMRAWCDAKPGNRKTKKGMKAFIVNWLGREQNSARPALAVNGSRPASRLQTPNRDADYGRM